MRRLWNILRLLAQYASALLEEPARVDALLADLCDTYHWGGFLLAHALGECMPAEFLAQPQGTVIHWWRLSQRMLRGSGFLEGAAQWAVES